LLWIVRCALFEMMFTHARDDSKERVQFGIRYSLLCSSCALVD